MTCITRNIRLGLLTAIMALALPLLTTALPVLSPAAAEAAVADEQPAASPQKPPKNHKYRKHSRSRRHSLSAPRRHYPDEARRRFAALVVDANNGHILYQVNADAPRHPASLTKMMTLYLLFEALRKGDMHMDTLMPVSATAASQQPTNIELTRGDRITVRTAIESIIVRSANDSAMVVAEALGGSVPAFASMMNHKARQLGMTRTRFYNPNGLPDDRQVTTAFDMARLGIALRRDFPEYYHYFSLQEFTYRDRLYEGHNHLLGRYPGADGVKTGYIATSGFNLVTSVKRGDRKLVGVIMGGVTASSRDQQMIDMLDNIFSALAHGDSSGRHGDDPEEEKEDP